MSHSFHTEVPKAEVPEQQPEVKVPDKPSESDEARKERADKIFNEVFEQAMQIGGIPQVEEPTEAPDGRINAEEIPERIEKPDIGSPPIVREAQEGQADSIFNEVFGQIMQTGEIPQPGKHMELHEGKIYVYDDNGKPYLVDGKLEPNTTYELNGTKYETDENRRIVKCEAHPERTPENSRDIDAQAEAGGKDRREGDQGGHIQSRDLGGDAGKGNLVAMDSRINQSDYKKMENDIKKSIDAGNDITTETELSYTGDSERPDKITTTVYENGEKKAVYSFDNNLDGSLVDKVKETSTKEDVKTVESVKNEVGGEISSIKEEFDKDGNLTKTTVNITYVDENGNNRRTTVVIEHGNGGD